LGSLNSGGASSPRATPLAARGFTHRRKKPVVSGAASSSLHFSASGEDPRHLQKEKTPKQQWVLTVSFL